VIRFLDAAGLPCQVYAVEVDGVCESPEELEWAVRAQRAGDLGDRFCTPAQNGCVAIEGGAHCGERTYAGRPYCPKHWWRFRRTGDPARTRKRGPKPK